MSRALWQIYHRPERPLPFAQSGNLPYADPAFSERMLQLHLDDSHGAASRNAAERQLQIDWLWERCRLQPDQHLLDLTCGPGLYAVPFAERGCRVTGIDIAPAAIRYAQALAEDKKVTHLTDFVRMDVRDVVYPSATFDMTYFLYGQIAVYPQEVAQQLLEQAAHSLKPGGHLIIELLDPAHIDTASSTWWFTDDSGLWGDGPFLHLGERLWYPDQQLSLERYHILHLETGELNEIFLCDQSYQPVDFHTMLRRAGFTSSTHIVGWDSLSLYDKQEWIVYIATR